MKTYCLSCKKRTDNIGPKNVLRTNKVSSIKKCYLCSIKVEIFKTKV